MFILIRLINNIYIYIIYINNINKIIKINKYCNDNPARSHGGGGKKGNFPSPPQKKS